MRRVLLAVGLGASCGSTPAYVATTEPIDVGSGIRLCVAVDPTDPKGVWHWGPGRTGCDSRSTGPGVFTAEEGAVVPGERRYSVEVRFRLQLHSPPPANYVEVRLMLGEDGFLEGPLGHRVSTERRDDLDLPEVPPYGRAPAS